MSPTKKRKRTSLPSLESRSAQAQEIAAAALPIVPVASASTAAPPATSAAASATTATPSNAAPAAEEPDSDDEQYYPALALPASAKKPSRAFTALALLPPVRTVEPRNQKTLDLLRPSNREAYLVQCVGALSTPPCKPCSKGLGPWKQCCVVAGFLKGSCANCHYSGEGKRCSLRPASKDTAEAAGHPFRVAALSPVTYYRQCEKEALRLPRAARASRRADLYLELAALAAADAAEDGEGNGGKEVVEQVEQEDEDKDEDRDIEGEGEGVDEE